MEKLRIYRIDDKYIRFLKSRDSRVQDNKGRRRPYVGIVLCVGRFQYFVPMESPKPSHATMKNGKHFLRLDEGRMGILGFNNMIPVDKDALISFDILAETDVQYRNLLTKQAELFNKLRAEIFSRASRTYYDVTNHKNKFLERISCDFPALEKACLQYRPR